jgi:hypothetical protein
MAERFFILWRTLAQRVTALSATPAARERALASAVFAGIFVVALGSLDYLITGGPDWNPGGAELQSVQMLERVAATSLHVVAAETPPPAPPVQDAAETAELNGPIAEWASANYESENAPNAEFYELQNAGKQIEITFPAAPSLTGGKNKPLATLS